MSSSKNRPRRSKNKRKLLIASGLFAVGCLAIVLFPSRENPPVLKSSSLTEELLTPASYTHQVRPILATHCYSCHSGSAATPPRLDTQNVSTIFTALHHKRGGLGLPEDEIHQELLTLRESSLLMRWREEGASHEPHWAFQPLPRDLEAPKEFLESGWAQNEIDRFQLAHLAEIPLRPQQRADKMTLLRRISIDLNGQAPSPTLLEESLTWEEDDQEKHYQALVEEMIASKKFGATLGGLWFDVLSLRHDPSEEEHAPPFSLWQDWVIDSINRNQPISEFIRAQLAGDQIDAMEKKSALPTAIFRTPLRQQNESLSEDRQRIENLSDRVSRFAKGFLGFPLVNTATGGSSPNPINENDFETLRLLFQLKNESGKPPGHSPGAPTIALRPEASEQEISKTIAGLLEIDEQIESDTESSQLELEEWLNGFPEIPVIPDLVAAFHCDTPGDMLLNQALGKQKARGATSNSLVAPGVLLNALVLGGGAHADILNLSTTSPTQAWTLSCWIRLLDLDKKKTILFERKPRNNEPGRFFLEYSQEVLRAGWERDGSAQSVLVSADITFDQAREWAHLTWTCSGSGKAAGLQLYWNGQALPQKVLSDSLPVPVFHPEDSSPLRAGSEDTVNGSFLLDELHFHERSLTPLEIGHLGDQQTLFNAFQEPADHLRGLTDYYFSSISESQRALKAQRRVKQELLATLKANPVELPVLETKSREIGDNLTPLFANLFPPSSARIVPNREDLAEWMTEPDHPLTARVFVNHVWTHFFGRGLVSGSFGLDGGAVPQYDLLDWLARDFVDNGWDLKRLCRQIVLSNTYRQSRPEPPLLSPRQQLRVLLQIADLTEPEIKQVKASFYQPVLEWDWTPREETGSLLLSEELATKTARRITKKLLHLKMEDEAIMRELFLRFRGQDETDPEFPLLLDLLTLQKRNFSEDDEAAPKLVLGGGASEDQPDGLDPTNWAAWIEICTSLLNDEGIRRQR